MPEDAELTCLPSLRIVTACCPPPPKLLSHSGQVTMETIRLCDEAGVGLWLPDAGAEALSLLFSTARSCCIAHHGTYAKQFPSPVLQGRWPH